MQIRLTSTEGHRGPSDVGTGLEETGKEGTPENTLSGWEKND